MLRLRYLSWFVICAVLFATLNPALPAHAVPLQQDDVADRIAEIRSVAPDIEDDFSEDGLFETGYDGTTVAYLKSGELRIAVDEENTLAWSSLDQKVADFYMEIDAIHREGSFDNQFGILARFDEDTNYYLFAASSDGYYTIQLFLDSEWEAIVDWTKTDQIEIGDGSVNTLGLLAERDTYTFLINDTIVDSATDDTLGGTTLALNAAAFSEPPIDIAFDNFRLWYIGDPILPAPRQAPLDGRNLVTTPEPSATAAITAEPTAVPTEEPTEEPPVAPTAAITAEPTEEATPETTEEATTEVTEEPTAELTEEPTPEPTAGPTEEPTAEPTAAIGTSSDPTIAVIQGQVATFRDDFEDGDADGWVNYTSDTVAYAVVDGALEFVFSAPNVLTWSELPVTSTNYYIEIDATLAAPVQAAEYGIIFNYLDSQNFYLYAVNNASRFSVWRLVNNGWEVVYEWDDAVALVSGEGNTNRLGLLAQDNTIILTANDEVLAEIDSEDASLGSIAVAAGTFDEADLTMTFDNVTLWDLDVLGELPATAPTDEPIDQPTAEPTAEPTEESVSDDFSAATARIAEITATDPDLIDDFRRDSGTWDTQSHEFGAYYHEGRAFHIEASADERIVWSAYYADDVVVDPVVYRNFYVEFDTIFITRTGENAAGLVFRLIDTDNFYKFVVDEIGYFQLQKRVDGEYSDIIEWDLTDEADDSEGGINRIGVLAEGSSLAFTVNGTVIAQAEDSDLDSGAIALAIQTYSTPEGHSTFDNLDLWILDE